MVTKKADNSRDISMFSGVVSQKLSVSQGVPFAALWVETCVYIARFW